MSVMKIVPSEFRGKTELQLAELVCDKYLDYFSPNLESERHSNIYWLKRYIEVLVDDPLRREKVRRKLVEFSPKYQVPQQADWSEGDS